MANKPKKNYDYKPYPKHDAVRSGCKVAWYYYRDKAQAEKAAAVARHNAAIQASLGYDFGYQSPGYSVTKVNPEHWPKYAGMYEVCIP